MAVPLLRIGLAVLFFAFCKVAESSKWKAVTFRTLLEAVVTSELDHYLPNMVHHTRIDLINPEEPKGVIAVLTETGLYGLILRLGDDKSGELEDAELFTKTTESVINENDSKSEVKTFFEVHNKIIFRNSRSQSVILSVDICQLSAKGILF
eukprot:GHVS01038384.1.p1 GENE.GHVS01038384.1~~GHVS01038384.1.p1  ORF type:complete len:151 (+),score=8.44 GHVS01038384.1:191-643(+)